MFSVVPEAEGLSTRQKSTDIDVRLINQCIPIIDSTSYSVYLLFLFVCFSQQVMQFGRIDGNAYILDFQYPFSAVQAFAVALANVTQRLK